MAQDQAANVAVIEPEQETERRQQTDQRNKPKRQPKYHVILWDDQHHTHAYVMVMLQKLFGHPLEKGFLLAQEVDTKGKAVVLTTTREHAELKRDQIHAFGKDGIVAACKGSMSASIEAEVG